MIWPKPFPNYQEMVVPQLFPTNRKRTGLLSFPDLQEVGMENCLIYSMLYNVSLSINKTNYIMDLIFNI